ncbi:MAG: oxysterol binding protein [Monoraphidium minutum]|nr:MAG: oxysterol binding protein [Monoraphidium minutum]
MTHTHARALVPQAKSSMFNMAAVKEYVGADVLSLLSVPVFIMEPMSMLQKMGEVLEYAELLDAADAAEDPLERMALVAAFLVAPFGACERAWKPFNPMLGETFELEGLGEGKDGRFLAEQVAISPPIGVAHAEGPRWQYDIVSAPKTRFLGNSLEVFPNGRTRIQLRSRAETYTHVPPHVKVHSIVIGRTWIDVEGEFYVFCPESGAKCVLNFTPCGWFNAGRYEVSGHVCDAEGARRLQLSGLWSSHLDAADCGPDGEPAPDAPRRRLWSCKPKPEGDYYGRSHFAKALGTAAGLRSPPLPSDSRRRPDVEALSGHHFPRAAAEKSRLEAAAHKEEQHRAAAGAAWAPRWFELEEGAALLPGEMDAAEVPTWRWKAGGFGALDAAGGGGAPDDAGVVGRGFAPWEFPELHAEEHAVAGGGAAAAPAPA